MNEQRIKDYFLKAELCNSGQITFENISDIWLNNKKSYTKESTFAQYRCIVNNLNKCNMWTKIPIVNINKSILTSVGEELMQKYEPRTAKLYILTINQILNYAADEGYIIEHFKISSNSRTVRASRPEVFTLNEQKALTKYLIEDIDYNKLGVLICLYTGLRLGEICGLRWEDVDLKKQIIRVSRTIQRVCDGQGSTYMLIGSPKSECSARDVPIPNFLKEIMESFISEPSFYVTTGTATFTQPRTYQNIVKRYYAQSNISQYHFHTLRHTFASRAIELGFDPKSLSEILGHSSVKITLDLYVHPSMEAKKKEMERFSDFVSFS